MINQSFVTATNDFVGQISGAASGSRSTTKPQAKRLPAMNSTLSSNEQNGAGDLSSLSMNGPAPGGSRNVKNARHNSIAVGGTSSSTAGGVGGGQAAQNSSNIYASMDEASFVQAGAISGRQHRDPRKHHDHRKYDKDKPKPYLDWNEFLSYMLEDQ